MQKLDLINLNELVSKFSIGATAAIITSMGLIVGLAQGAATKSGIITGLLVVAIADNVSDSLGIHMYSESQGAKSRDVAVSTYGNFLVRLLITFIFIGIVLLLRPATAAIASATFGLVILTVMSYYISLSKKSKPSIEILWHLVVAIAVIFVSKYLGVFIASRLLS